MTQESGMSAVPALQPHVTRNHRAFLSIGLFLLTMLATATMGEGRAQAQCRTPQSPIGEWTDAHFYLHQYRTFNDLWFLGCSTSDYLWTPDHVGLFIAYEHGAVYYSPNTGAHEVHGAIHQKWAALDWERGLGYPTTDELPALDGGRFNNFERGSIYWHPNTGAHAVYGAIYQWWASEGYEHRNGYPVTDETAGDGTFCPTSHRQQTFGHYNVVCWSPSTGVYRSFF